MSLLKIVGGANQLRYKILGQKYLINEAILGINEDHNPKMLMRNSYYVHNILFVMPEQDRLILSCNASCSPDCRNEFYGKNKLN